MYLYLLSFTLMAAGVLGATKCDYLFESANDIGYSEVRSSKTCKDLLNNEWKSYRKCNEQQLDVSLFTETVFPADKHFLPFIRLNMSANVLKPAESIFFFYSCLHAPDQTDNYCHDKDIQLNKYGELVEPCRGFIVNDSAAEFRADVNCFRLYGESQYMVTVAIRPQNCRTELFLTMPRDNRYDPRIYNAFDQDDPQGKSYEQWSPFLFVDTTPSDGIWIRYEEPPKAAKVLDINLNLYSKEGDKIKLIKKMVVNTKSTGKRSARSLGSQKVVDRGKIDFLTGKTDDTYTNLVSSESQQPALSKKAHLSTGRRFARSVQGDLSTGIKAQNLEKGEYVVVGYVKRHNCELHCNNDGCEICLYTMLNFTLSENKFTTTWKRIRPLVNAAKSSLTVLIGIIIILCISAVVLVIYIKFIRPKLFSRRPAQQFELQESPKLLIVYSDDSESHSDAVAQLAHFLRQNANAQVHLDQFDLADPNVRPSVWLQQHIDDCDYVIVVFSEACRQLMNGKQMRQRRPYPDLFNSALFLVITAVSRITNTAPIFSNNSTTPSQNGNSNLSRANLAKFIVTRFDYSSPTVIPDFFNLARCKTFVIPNDLKLLVAHLHHVETDGNRLEYQTETGEIDRSISLHKQFMERNPGFLEDRFMTAEEIEKLGPIKPTDLPEQINRPDLADLGQKLGLITSAESDEEDTGLYSNTSPQYPLIHPDDLQDSDEDS
ncbi:unnamed protein product [Bursaphelenchus okinawaensis]|uniref:SEFIR domain-containing protein n=1 Tax=Bursaphelenchus okinawaensis TaxID=465554 RepID=A0A811K1L3_9BILA|nr:unnamed protein product [Bursaphelenchus okinawaensis]CAG9089009.1 unnamed protein product [Bursaphelenchus okinawaensis]